MNKNLLVLIAAVVLSACGGVSSSEKKCTKEKIVKEKPYKYASMKDGVLHLDLNEARKHPREVKLSDICDSLIYIPLETKKKCLLGRNINRVEIDGDDVFIHDGWKLFHFDISGKFIGQLGKTGRGPGEYVCTEFCLDRDNKKVYVRACYKHRILEFDYQGNLKSDSIKAGGIINNMYYDSKNNCIVGSGDYCMSKISGDYNILRKIDVSSNSFNQVLPSKYFPKGFFDVKLNSKIESLYISADICSYSGGIYFQELLNDTVYRYDNKKVLPHVILNNSAFRKELKSSVFMNNKLAYFTDPEYNYATLAGETSRYMFFGAIPPLFIYDKEGKALSCLKSAKNDKNLIHNDIDKIFDFDDFFRRIKEEKYLYSMKRAYDFIEKVEESNGVDSKYSKRINEIKRGLKEESNPVLVLARLKK